MALPSSGAISLNQVNVELGNAGTASINMGSAAVRGLFGVASGAISMSDGYGKSSQFEFSIASNQTDANLRTLAVSAGWDQSSKLVATINSGIYISATSTGSTGLTVDGSYPGGVELVNNGYIVGMGGRGGNGGGSSGTTGYAGSVGSAGGKALHVASSVSITNNGIIGGGGGGGGGGGVGRNEQNQGFAGGGGGGGGQTGTSNSSGGSRIYAYARGSNGSSGTLSSAGAGGNGGYMGTNYGQPGRGGKGGTGGNWGSNGSNGAGGTGQYTRSGGGGGGAGVALTGNSNITWLATGTRYGGIS